MFKLVNFWTAQVVSNVLCDTLRGFVIVIPDRIYYTLPPMATKILHHITLHDIEVIDGDTIAAWLDFDGVVRVKRRIRLQGIEAGELHEASGLAAKQFLADVVMDRILHTAVFAGGMRREDQHGRLVADIVFDTGETLCQLCLSSGRYWRRNRDGSEDKAPHQTQKQNQP